MENKNIVEVKDVTFAYEEKNVLDDVSLSIAKGEFAAIIGPNGSGKSTLVNIMVGRLKPQRGRVFINGKDINAIKDKSFIGFLPQRSFAFNQAFPASIEEVVSMGLYAKAGLFQPLRKKHWQKVHEALELTGMLDYRKQLIGHLSGGQQQRVFIARALVSDPEILFLDEPMVGVDVQSQQALFELLERLNKDRGITIVMITHDVWAITDKVNRIICMGNGHIYPDCSLDNIGGHMLEDIYGYPIKLESHIHRSR